jgi:hypothetical protein
MSILDRAKNLQSPRVRELFVSVIEDCMREMGRKHKRRQGIKAVCNTRKIEEMMEWEKKSK